MVHASSILLAAAVGSTLLSAAAGALAYVRTRERTDSAGAAIAATLLLVAAWSATLGLQLAAGTTATAEGLLRLKWIISLPIVTTSLLFAITYAGYGEWLTPPRVVALAAEPAAVGALVVVNPNAVFLAGIEPRTVFGVLVLVGTPGPALVAHLMYSVVAGAAFIALLARTAVRSSGPYRTQAAVLCAGTAAPIVTLSVFALELSWLPPVDLTPLGFGTVSLVLLVAMTRYDLFDVASVAHETVFAGLDDAIVVVDDDDRVLETNPAARDAFGLDGDEIGADAERVLPDAVVESGLLDDDGGDNAEIVLDEPDPDIAGDGGFGEQVPDPTYFEATCESLGREGVRLLVFRNVTEQQRIRRRYRAYVEHSEDIVAVADADGVLEYISPAAEIVLGYDTETLEGEEFTDYIHPDDRRSVVEQFAESLHRPGERVHVSFRAEHRDGGWRVLDGVGVNRFDDPHIGGYLLTLRDETRRDRYEQRLRVLTRVLRHDLRNELNVVHGYADVIADEDGDAADYAERIQRSAERLASLGTRVRGVDQTLRRTDHGGRPVDVTRVVGEVADRTRDRFPEMTVTVEADEAVAYADELLATAVWNVMENAGRHHDGDRPEVSVTLSSTPETTELRIADDGPGIPAEDREAVESGHETQLRHASGLGLWLVRWIVDGVDGELSFVDGEEATAEPIDDVGTVVVLRLRAADAESVPTGSIDQMDPWDVTRARPQRTDGGDDDDVDPFDPRVAPQPPDDER
ncbi:histidine kinase N-terminal 7TM domain-containing protein [Halobaculum rubrum]|uniref:histidine kinase N-terminal 7TM domain-containing protein n=1 Tax=Halobaculum rubrum TaxID=2872158 RepID=UPI001CA3A1F4|nr:histidine kinase N-terminal 7TM domain-containing protein [Halobaculum rubrum]QZX98647.1 PAS domain S-box protein [Halobaculum rubrum]